MELRTCKQCNIEKEITAFYKNAHSVRGRLPICAKCHYAKHGKTRIRYKYPYKYRLSTARAQQRNQQKKRFGGNFNLALERDGFACVKCGLTKDQHLAKYGVMISVDHIDGKGRYSEVKNHALENLQTLCISCHGRKDGKRRKTENGR